MKGFQFSEYKNIDMVICGVTYNVDPNGQAACDFVENFNKRFDDAQALLKLGGSAVDYCNSVQDSLDKFLGAGASKAIFKGLESNVFAHMELLAYVLSCLSEYSAEKYFNIAKDTAERVGGELLPGQGLEKQPNNDSEQGNRE